MCRRGILELCHGEFEPVKPVSRIQATNQCGRLLPVNRHHSVARHGTNRATLFTGCWEHVVHIDYLPTGVKIWVKKQSIGERKPNQAQRGFLLALSNRTYPQLKTLLTELYRLQV